MRIVIDMQGAQTESRYRGIGRYTTSLVQAIVRNKGSHEIILVLNGLFPETIPSIRATFDGLLPAEHICVWEAPGPVNDNNDRANSWRRQAAEIIRESFIELLCPDVVCLTSLFEGFVDNGVTSIGSFMLTAPTVAILYDLIPLLNPQDYLDPDPSYKSHYVKKIESCKKASAWFAISEFSAKEGIDSLGLPKEYVFNISTAADPVFRKIEEIDQSGCEVLRKYGLVRPFVLYTGGSDRRKNLPCLVRAYAALPISIKSQHQLIFAGRMPEGDIVKLRMTANNVGLTSDDLIFTGYVSDEELVLLYNLCRAFVFPSWHEGFGLPVLEAMSCGAPVIAANTSSLPEVVGNPDALFDPRDEKSVTALIEKTLTDEDFRRQLQDAGLLRTPLFSWDISAQRAIAAFEYIHSGSDVEKAKSLCWIDMFAAQRDLYRDAIKAIGSINSPSAPSDMDLRATASALASNEKLILNGYRRTTLPDQISWRLEGPFDSSYSLALVNRETARALSELDHKVALHSTEGPGDFEPSSEFLSRNHDIESLYRRGKQQTVSDVEVVSRNLYPPRVADLQGQLNFLHGYAWEETAFPSEWVEQFNEHLQGMAVTSEHVKKIMIDNGVTIPLRVTGNGVDHWNSIEADKSFSLTGKAFRFLHVSSCFPRKGVENLLEAYGIAFSADDDVVLIIKTFRNPHNKVQELLKELTDKKSDFPDVQIIEEDFSDNALKSLYTQCNALVAPSKAEGFGLPMAEAMLSGLPVITTGWSGQRDFCTEETAWLVDYEFERAQSHFGLFDSIWANPNVEHLAQAMRDVFETPKEALQQRVDKGRELLLERFSWRRVAATLVDAARYWARMPETPRPRIGWITTWNVRCGVAMYSAHLLEYIPTRDLTVFAARNLELLQSDQANVVRVWGQSESETLDDLAQSIDEARIETLVIQFNYGFFNFKSLERFILTQTAQGRQIVIVLHSTTDPTHVSNKKLVDLRRALCKCTRVLVHTPTDLNRLKSIGVVDNTTLFPHGINRVFHTEEERPDGAQLHKKYSYKIGSYGFFLPHKGLLELIDAIALLRSRGHSVTLRMVNAEYPALESADLIRQARSKIKRLGLGDVVELCSEYLPDHESMRLLSQADLVVCPYQHTAESSSAAVRSALACGRPVAVTPLPIFDDVTPAVFTLPGIDSEAIADGIWDIVEKIQNSSTEIQQKKAATARWCNDHQYDKLACRLYGMIQALARGRTDRAL